MGTLLADSNEAMRCEYISTILHASLYIVKRITEKEELTLVPKLEVVGEESTGRVDYAIKALEELICITEGKLHQVTMASPKIWSNVKVPCNLIKRIGSVSQGKRSGKTSILSTASLQQPRIGILFFSHRMEYQARVRIPSISDLPNQP